jgi:hypothetical protein
MQVFNLLFLFLLQTTATAAAEPFGGCVRARSLSLFARCPSAAPAPASGYCLLVLFSFCFLCNVLCYLPLVVHVTLYVSFWLCCSFFSAQILLSCVMFCVVVFLCSYYFLYLSDSIQRIAQRRRASQQARVRTEDPLVQSANVHSAG